jgi:hypothetical protein
MTRARDIANLVDANGDIVAGALDNVPASNDASALTTGTLDGARLPSTLPAIDGSALTGIATDLVDDTTPQLGGNLDLNSSSITGTGNINTTGTATFSGLATANNANLTAEGGSATVDVRQSSAKVWANVNGVNNIVRDSYNLSSMSDQGTGKPRINFANNMNNGNYSVPFNTGGHSGVNRMDAMRGLENGSFTTSRCQFYTGAESNLQYYDSSNVHSAVFGDLA